MIKVTLIGNLGFNAVINSVSNQKVINFSVAQNEKFTDNTTGEIKERTTWFQCSYWRSEGQSCKIVEFLRQGTKVYVEGVPFINTYADKNGEKQVSLSVRVSYVELLGGAKSEDKELNKEIVEQNGYNSLHNEKLEVKAPF